MKTLDDSRCQVEELEIKRNKLNKEKEKLEKRIKSNFILSFI
jgi:hypothetical protein